MASKCFVMFRKDFFKNFLNSPIFSSPHLFFFKEVGVSFNSEIFDQTGVCVCVCAPERRLEGSFIFLFHVPS